MLTLFLQFPNAFFRLFLITSFLVARCVVCAVSFTCVWQLLQLHANAFRVFLRFLRFHVLIDILYTCAIFIYIYFKRMYVCGHSRTEYVGRCMPQICCATCHIHRQTKRTLTQPYHMRFHPRG